MFEEKRPFESIFPMLTLFCRSFYTTTFGWITGLWTTPGAAEKCGVDIWVMFLKSFKRLLWIWTEPRLLEAPLCVFYFYSYISLITLIFFFFAFPELLLKLEFSLFSTTSSCSLKEWVFVLEGSIWLKPWVTCPWFKPSWLWSLVERKLFMPLMDWVGVWNGWAGNS